MWTVHPLIFHIPFILRVESRGYAGACPLTLKAGYVLPLGLGLNTEERNILHIPFYSQKSDALQQLDGESDLFY